MQSPTPLSIRKKLTIYILSVVLAPFGLYWFFKYVRNPDYENRKVAWIVLMLTVVAVVISTLILKSYISTLGYYVQEYETIYSGL
jgi:uncharacterized BrkB/YihY/UPF0761 family membrane protein